MSSYQYRKSHYGDKTVVRSSYLHNGISYTGKMVSLYWFSPQGPKIPANVVCVYWWPHPPTPSSISILRSGSCGSMPDRPHSHSHHLSHIQMMSFKAFCTFYCHGSYKPGKVMEFQSCLEKSWNLMLAWKNYFLPGKVIENQWKSLKNINLRKLDIFRIWLSYVVWERFLGS